MAAAHMKGEKDKLYRPAPWFNEVDLRLLDCNESRDTAKLTSMRCALRSCGMLVDVGAQTRNRKHSGVRPHRTEIFQVPGFTGNGT